MKTNKQTNKNLFISLDFAKSVHAVDMHSFVTCMFITRYLLWVEDHTKITDTSTYQESDLKSGCL